VPLGQPSPRSWAKYKKAKQDLVEYGDPVNIRTIVDTFSGNTSPITEKSFTKEDLKFLADTYYRKKEANSKDEAMYKRMVNKYDNNPTNGLAYELVDGKLTDTTGKHIQNLRDKLASYDKTRGKTSITYADYGGNKVNQEANWLKQLSASFDKDPAYRIATTLGRFNVVEDDKGHAYIKDTYDWTDPKGGTLDYFKAIPGAIKSLEGIGNLAMRGLRPNTARDVNIKLPRKKLNGYYGKLYRPDGRVSTELSTTMGIDGVDVEMPLLVPGQKSEYIDIMMNTAPEKLRKVLPNDAYKIAQNHAIGRMKQKLDPFWQEGEKVIQYGKYSQPVVNIAKK